MFKMNNPFDISKDGQNAFIDGVNFHIRQSAENVNKIMDYINKYVRISGDVRPLDILEYAMTNLNISDSELTVADEHHLLDWIRTQFRD